MATNAERQKAFRARQAENGITTVSGLVHARQLANVKELLRRLKEDPDLEVLVVRNARTGRMEKL